MTERTALIQPPFYQAIGIVEGILEINDPNNTLTIGDRCFAVSVAKAARKKHQPQTTQSFRVYPNLRKGQTAFKVVSVVDSAPTNFTLKGCWELCEDQPFFIVYRNSIYFPGDRNLRTLVLVDWENAPEPDGQFWALEAELKGDRLSVLKADGPFNPPPKATRYQPPAVASSTDATTQPHIPKSSPTTVPTAAQPKAQPTIPTPPAIPLTPQEILTMATPAKISLTCKLNQVPAHRELPDKRIEFFLKDGSDRIFTVQVKPKVFKKLTGHGFDSWVAAIGGDLGPSTETGFELLNASIQVFEKKPPADAQLPQQNIQATEAKTPAEKPPAPASTTAKPSGAPETKAAAATTRVQPKTEAGDTQVPVNKRKGLLDGVRLK